MSNVYYPDYLQLERILNAQELESDKLDQHAHDEMLFIIIHQAYELWFKQLLYEVGSIMDIFSSNKVDDNSGELNTVVHRMRRVNVIVDLLVKQLGILDTMTPLDFLDFRDMLRPASGFQSMQFKILEAKLGLRMEDRFGKEYYTSQLHPEHKAQIEALEKETTLVEMVNGWLGRMPFLNEEYWPGEERFFDKLKQLYVGSLVKGEEQNARLWEEIFEQGNEKRKFTAKAARNGLFIMMFRDEPIFQQPFRFLDSLVELDNGMARWRARHVDMVHRMIGLRLGTGGSTGKGYLRGAMDHHYVFKELADLGSFLFERRKLPQLPDELRQAMRFA